MVDVWVNDSMEISGGKLMTAKTIRSMKITNFKSIDSLEFKDGLTPFTVFAGPNGSGKSNFFDALDFVSIFIRNGIDAALRSHGRYENIHSEKKKAGNARRFDFEIECVLSDNRDEKKDKDAVSKYSLSIHQLDDHPQIEERLSVDGNDLMVRLKGEPPVLKGEGDKKGDRVKKFPQDYSALLLFFEMPLVELLRNLKLYRIDPLGAKEPNLFDRDPTELERKGHNLASVLNRMESNKPSRDAILEWMEMIVPGIENIQTEQQKLESKTAVLFKEHGTSKRFPAYMVSDGTIYALCLLVAVLDSPSEYGMTLIEEPERGLHPKAIRELVGLIRDQASPANPIWLSTHSESVVRELRMEELVLVDKKYGRTKMKAADSGNLSQENLAPLGLDEAWLSNLLDGGLPW